MSEANTIENSVVTIKNVTFMYTSVSRAVEQLNTDNKPPLSTSPLEFHSYEVKILIPESRFKKELKKPFAGAKNLPNVKEFDSEECLEKFGIETDDDMVLIKFAQTALVGVEGKRRESFPIKQIGIKGKVQDLDGNTIDHETSIGNGSLGHLQFRPVQGKNGLYLYPHLICVTNLIEYVAAGVEDDFDSLGLEDLAEVDMDAVAVEAPVVADPEDDIPF